MPARLLRLLLALLLSLAVAGVTLVAGPTAAEAASSKPLKVAVMSTYTAPYQGERSAAVRALQRRLQHEGVLKKKYVTSYYGVATANAVKRFQQRSHLKVTGKVDKKTWSRLVKASGKLSTHTSAKVRSLPKRCKVQGRVLCADKTTRKLYYLVDSTLVKTVDARFGCSGSRHTREGTFSVLRKDRHHVSTIYHTPMPFSMFFSGGQAVHYSADFAARGYAGCSHGCVNVRDWNTLEYLYGKVKVGDRVVVYRG